MLVGIRPFHLAERLAAASDPGFQFLTIPAAQRSQFDSPRHLSVVRHAPNVSSAAAEAPAHGPFVEQ
jgi:hypothetical protein